MTLGEKQRRFVHDVGILIQYAYQNGFELTFGDAYRTPEQAAQNAANKIGIANSLHTQRLAIDLNLFVNGEYQSESAAYETLGIYWEQMGQDHAWGGRFSRPDGNHFSIEHEGVR